MHEMGAVLAMGASILLHLKNGKRVTLVDDEVRPIVDAVRANLDRWLRRGEALLIAHADGTIEEVTPREVEAVEVLEEDRESAG